MDKKIIEDLYNYRLCKITKIDKADVDKYPNAYIHTNTNGDVFACEADEEVNTLILFNIYKCVFFIRNLFLTGLVCGVIGIILSFSK